MFFPHSDLYFIFFVPAMLLAMIASFWVQSAFARWKRVRGSSGLTGAEAADLMMRQAGISGVSIEQASGMLSDHYDPQKKALRLSPDVYGGNSVASVGVALHEAGHALQDAQHYAPLALRSAMVPIVSIGGGYLPVILIMLGLFFKLTGLAYLGLLVFAAAVVFSLVTLPVEFNASSRAKAAAVQLGIVSPGQEAHGVSAVLNAAAMTYVAAAVTALLHLLYYAMLVLGRRD